MDSRFNVKWGKISKGQTHAHKYLRSVSKKNYVNNKLYNNNKTTYVNNNLYFYVKKIFVLYLSIRGF